MARKVTKEEFIGRARKAHGEKYDYSKIKYVNIKTKVTIICPIHGAFEQSPDNHVRGHGCPKCAGMKTGTMCGFITKAKQKHGNKYDYSKVQYVNNKTKVCIICPEHGAFWQTPDSHLRGSGCCKCGLQNTHDAQTKDVEAFISQAKEIHGDKYDYSNVVYKNCKAKVDIICCKHGEFSQTPSQHLNGRGCPICAIESRKRLKYGVAINDMLNQERTKCYAIWDGILQRCFGRDRLSRSPSYANCTVCQEWLTFSNFKKWFDEHYIKDYHIDKDIHSQDNNKMYSPDTCVFIPARLNTMLSHIVESNGGVKKHMHTYAVSTTMDGKHYYKGGYKTEEDAHRAYAIHRLDRIFNTASEMWENREIDDRTYLALSKKLAAYELDFEYIGIEINPDYFDKAVERVRKHIETHPKLV